MQLINRQRNVIYLLTHEQLNFLFVSFSSICVFLCSCVITRKKQWMQLQATAVMVTLHSPAKNSSMHSFTRSSSCLTAAQATPSLSRSLLLLLPLLPSFSLHSGAGVSCALNTASHSWASQQRKKPADWWRVSHYRLSSEPPLVYSAHSEQVQYHHSQFTCTSWSYFYFYSLFILLFHTKQLQQVNHLLLSVPLGLTWVDK